MMGYISFSQTLSQKLTVSTFDHTLLTSRLLYSLLKFKTSVASSRVFLEYLVLMIQPQRKVSSAENARSECWEMALTVPTLMR